jgi:protein TilB
LTIAAKNSIEKKILADKDGTYNPNGYTKEFRRECYLEQKQRDEDRDKKSKENSMFKEYHEFEESMKPQGPPPVYNKDGGIRQINQGKYEWRFDETPDHTSVIFEIKVPKYMDT